MAIIKTKWGKCVDCEEGAKDQPLTAGRCPTHYRIFRSLVSEEKSRTRSSKLIVNERMNRIFAQPIPSSIETIKEFKKNMSPAIPESVKHEAKENKSELDKWFEHVATFIKADPFCENCGEAIPEKYYKHASAHIFPKSIFASVMTHPLNWLKLGASCGCHHEFDSSIDNACQMKIWPKAVERFKTFESLITENHKYLDLFKSKI
jgi:hypothetical protein